MTRRPNPKGGRSKNDGRSIRNTKPVDPARLALRSESVNGRIQIPYPSAATVHAVRFQTRSRASSLLQRARTVRHLRAAVRSRPVATARHLRGGPAGSAGQRYAFAGADSNPWSRSIRIFSSLAPNPIGGRSKNHDRPIQITKPGDPKHKAGRSESLSSSIRISRATSVIGSRATFARRT
jgi:hypothetical protein